ncbi:MAG: TolC family protein [candidate division WOR-3 bacterium]
MILEIILSSLLLLTEDEVVKIALSKSKVLLAEREKITQREGEEMIAISNFLPKASLNATYSFSSFTEKMTQYQIVGIDTINWRLIYQKFDVEFGKPERKGLIFSINQTVFDFLKSFHSYKASLNTKLSEIESFEGKKIYLENEIRKICTELLFLKKQIEVLEKTKDNLEAHYKIAEKRYKEGLASELELLQAEISLKNFYPQIEILKLSVQKLKDILKNLAGIEEEIELKDTLYFEKFDVTVDTLYEKALSERKDILSLKFSMEALKEVIEVQKGLNKPNIFFSYQYQYSKPYGFFKDEWGGYYTLVFGLSWNIFDGFSTYGNVKKSMASYEYLKKKFKFIEENIKSEIKNNIEALKTNERIVETQRENIKIAEKALRVAKVQYENGWISHIEYMDAELSALNTKLNFLKAIKDYKISKLNLIKTLKGAIEIGGF